MEKVRKILIFLLSVLLILPLNAYAEEEFFQQTTTTYHIYFVNIITKSGELIEEKEILTDTVSPGVSHGKAVKWFVNQMTNYTSYKGVDEEWTFTGEILDMEGNPLTSSIQMVYQEGYPEIYVYLYPQYNIVMTRHLLFNYIDNISTGTGSWSNENSMVDYTHTFSTPESQEGYEFLRWENFDTQESYAGGESVTIEYNSLPEDGSLMEITFYAVWQPSVTVNWYVNEELFSSQEEFYNGINAYSVTPEEEENIIFNGWFDENEERVDESTIFSPPEETIDGSPVVVNLFAQFTEITPEPEPEQGGEDPDPEPSPSPSPEPEHGEQEPDPEPSPSPSPAPEQEPKEVVIREIYTTETIIERNNTETINNNTETIVKEPIVEHKTEVITTSSPDIINNVSVPTQQPSTNTREVITNNTTTPSQSTREVVTVTSPQSETQSGAGSIPAVSEPKNNNSPTTTTTTPAPATSTVTTTEEKPASDVITPTPTPALEEIVEDTVPLAEFTPVETKHWALLNLIMVGLSFILSLGLALLFLRKREEEVYLIKHIVKALICILFTVALAFVFAITEDITLPMAYVDKYTWIMIVVFVIQLVMSFIPIGKKEID